MSASSPSGVPGRPNLVSLVVQSKNALHDGSLLCHRASTLENTSAQTALDVLVLNAKVRWISDAVLEQLKLAASVAKSIEDKRSKFEKQTQAWDTIRTERTNLLDNILDSLGSQLVPPDFHDTASDSSLFGSQSSSLDEEPRNSHLPESSSPGHSPSLTIRHTNMNCSSGRMGPEKLKGKDKGKGKRKEDRSRWKTLRDFVDERTIDEALEAIEADRASLDDIFEITAEYPVTLQDSLDAIRDALPPPQTINVAEILAYQGDISKSMAEQLESLTEHLEKMEDAANEDEDVLGYTEDDYQKMVKDAEELPVILSELEESTALIGDSCEQLLAAKALAQQHLDVHYVTLDDLEKLGDIMSEMLKKQQEVEEDCTERLDTLHQHLTAIEDLYHRFTLYQMSFNKVLVEVARRRQYKEAAENIVSGMMAQLQAMAEGEHQVRADFNDQYGSHLPKDISLYLHNPPTRWEVVPFDGEEMEVLPDADEDLVIQAKEAIVRGEEHLHGSQSL